MTDSTTSGGRYADLRWQSPYDRFSIDHLFGSGRQRKETR
jgi:hypothetical protein